MPHEIVGELLIGAAELGLSAVSDSNGKKNPWGCLLAIIIFMAIIAGICYYVSDETPQTKVNRGLITKKLSQDRVLIKTFKGEDVYTITHELYLNKNEGDSIVFNK